MKIYVDLDHVDITEYTQIESGEYNTNKINFIFTPEYKDLVKVAIFGCKLDTDEPKFYKIYLSDDSCYLPSEVVATSDVISIGVYAFNVENGELKLRYSPTPVKTIVYEGSFREEAENASSPTPTEIEQIMSRIISLEELTQELDTRVEALENKACDLDTLKSDVDRLKTDVDDLDERLDTAESDIDELEGDIANTYSKTEVDTLLGSKVDTTTFNSSQATQDEKIIKAELILSQLPRVTGEGTNISLSPTIEYDLEVGYKGDTKQNTLNGYNLLSPTEDFEQTVAGVTYTGSNGIYTIKGTSTGGGSTNQRAIVNYTIKDGDYIHLKNIGTINSNLAVVFTCSDNSTWSLSPNSLDRIVQLNQHVGKTITKMNFYQNGNTSGVALDITLSPMIIYNVSTSTDYESYCGGIPSPNPNYPQDIQVVTGTQTVTISNADNTETQTYTLHLGDLELAKIPNTTYLDTFKFTNNKWYKGKKVEKIASYNGETISTDYISTTGQLTTGAKVYYGIQEQDVEITNTTLLSDLEYIRTHAMSYSGTTNISSSGNLPVIISASALKGE